jgi:glyoxylase-like metal-dependent hydrolase (beta-lactamase superfamily II)/rhodanese-related sulfurtransferase
MARSHEIRPKYFVMIIQQIYTGCLAHGAYIIESKGEAAVIDPLREFEPYIEKAREMGANIKYILETHFHADFVSGHLDLAKHTGATIVYGPTAKPNFHAHIAKDGEVFKLGDVEIVVLHTPGHTLESVTYLLRNEHGKDEAIFTGDTLFIGDVGRPDLAQKLIQDLTPELLAGHLYDSLRNKIMPLADEVIVYPGHGAGSACGKKMSKETVDTLGHQKKFNYALNPSLTREEFIAEVLNGLTAPPQYFPANVLMNIQGYEPFDEVMKRANRALDVQEFAKLAEEPDIMILDARDPREFAKSFVPGSVNIGISGSFAPWVGSLIPDLKQKLLLIVPDGMDQEVITRLARVGYDCAIGYLKGGFKSWTEANMATDHIDVIQAKELFHKMREPETQVVDVRKESEYDSEHVTGAINAPLDYFENSIRKLDPSKKMYVHCAGGYRSMIFASLLKRKGIKNFVEVEGGFKAIKDAGIFSLSEYIAPVTDL